MSYGLSIDCGTTHISLSLVKKGALQTPFSLTLENPCRRFGADVITRADAQTKNPLARTALKEDVLRTVREGALILCDAAETTLETIKRIAFCANPIITHLTLGMDAEQLTRFPYSLSETFGKEIQNPLIPYGFSAEATFYVAPLASAFVGGDVLAGFCDCDTPAPHLFVDLGTNGEMILRHENTLFAASVAAGPALEGGLVKCGTRAKDGAIDHVEYRDGKFSFTTIRSAEPCGICATGLFELLLVSREAGLISENGLVKNEKITLAPNVSITTEEVRAVLLAKAAFSAGIRALLRKAAGAESSAVRLTLAGAFGNGMDLSVASRLGLFDTDLLPRAETKDHAALSGITQALFDEAFRKTLFDTGRCIQILDLATDAEFQEDYIRSISL